jgi:hypothetical protein
VPSCRWLYFDCSIYLEANAVSRVSAPGSMVLLHSCCAFVFSAASHFCQAPAGSALPEVLSHTTIELIPYQTNPVLLSSLNSSTPAGR